MQPLLGNIFANKHVPMETTAATIEELCLLLVCAEGLFIRRKTEARIQNYIAVYEEKTWLVQLKNIHC
jgi:hypothetical protein